MLLVIWLGWAQGGLGLESLGYTLYVPQSVLEKSRPRPMVVMLHGCDQTAEKFAASTQMNLLAEKERFSVLYPQQRSGKNPIGCWNWFMKKNQSADGEEPSAIVAVIKKVSKGHAFIDNKRVFVAGISSGGVMAGILASCFPEMFRAFAIHSSPSFRRASDIHIAVKLMNEGPKKLPVVNQDCTPENPLPLMVIQGTEDKVVHPSNADVLVSDLGDPFRSQVLMLENLGHAWSGGAPNMKYTKSTGPSSSKLIWKFFRATDKKITE